MTKMDSHEISATSRSYRFCMGVYLHSAMDPASGPDADP